MDDLRNSIFGEWINPYPDASPALLGELRRAAEECSGFAKLTDRGPVATQAFNYLNDRDPRAALFQRLQSLHLKAAGIVDEC